MLGPEEKNERLENNDNSISDAIYAILEAKSTTHISSHLLHQQCLMKTKLCILFLSKLTLLGTCFQLFISKTHFQIKVILPYYLTHCYVKYFFCGGKGGIFL